MEHVFNKTPRKRDYITFFAVILFVFVVVFELLLVSWLPNQMMAGKGIESETAKQEVIDLEDALRHSIKKYESRVKTGEVKLVSLCLDNIARYLRLNSQMMSRDQVREVMEDLTRFEMIMRGWKDSRSYSTKETLGTSAYFENMLIKQIDVKNN